MKAKIISPPQTILSNPDSKHAYFAWPTVVRTPDGRLMLGASGFRLRHVCPFGKCAVAFSSDEGKNWTRPMVAVDTPLDDRDVGLCAFGENSILLTTFNNTRAFQRSRLNDHNSSAYITAYLELITDEDEQKYCGFLGAVSHDNGNSFGPLFKAPVSSPHGPLLLDPETLFWVGTRTEGNRIIIAAYTSDCEGGKQTPVSVLPATAPDNHDYEPHAVLLPGGRIVCQIRAEREDPRRFTLCQTVSEDRGKTWSEPVQLLDDTGGAPAHLLYTSSGLLLSVYAKRAAPQKILAMVSEDEGRSWQTGLELAGCVSSDCGYPSTVELKNGSFLTAYYAHDCAEGPAVIKQVVWELRR